MSDFQFMGRPATVVIEMDMGKGRVLRVPVGDLASYTPDGPSRSFGELRIAVRDPLHRRLHDSIDVAMYTAGP